jgi:putative heme-binding domain-containing protein
MRRFVLPALLVAGLLLPAGTPGQDDPNIASTDPRTPADELKCFKLPPGFEAQLVAAEPDIHKPLNLNFDDRGRLWVTDTIEYPYAVPPGKKGRDTVKILEDFGPDGRARKITTWADGLNIPIGVLPLPKHGPQEALVFSIPAIHRFSEVDNKGEASQRRVLYKEYGQRDTHGLTSAFTIGFDGWVYALHGFSNTSTVQGADGQKLQMQSGNSYRLRPDGSHLEAFTRGQVNPFGLTWDPLGNLYSCDCHSQPVYQLLSGAYYPSFGKPHDGLGYGPEMTTDDHGSTAISGIVYYAADHFPREYLDTVFIGNVVTNRITLDRAVKTGSTPKAVRLPDFLISSDPWFRPVDIKLGPDGALYVADFYNRIIGHYEVPLNHPGRDRERGRIWRIIYRGLDGKGPPPRAPRTDWTQATVAELINDLGHPNLTVRFLASNQLVARGDPAVLTAVQGVLRVNDKKNEDTSIWRRIHGLWVLERCGGLNSGILKAALADVPAVRVHAQRILAGRPQWTEAEAQAVITGVKDEDADVRRAAAEGLGRHPAGANLRPLLDLLQSVPAADTHLRHVARMALRDQFLSVSGWAALDALPPTDKDLLTVADVALGAPTPESAAFLLKQLPRLQGEGLVRSVHHVARYGRSETTDPLLAFLRTSRPEDLGHQVALFRALDTGTQERGGKLDEAARTWAVTLTGRLLASPKASDVQAGAELIAGLRLLSEQGRLVELALRRDAPPDVRTAALKGLAALDAVANAGTLGKVLTDADAPIGVREQSANLLASANQPATRAQLVAALATAPARLETVLAAGLAGSDDGAALLLQTVESGKASARLLQERAVEVKLKERKLPGLAERVARLTKGLPPADAAVQELLKKKRERFLQAKADASKGQQVFVKHCANCHQLGGQGARIGPQLDGIGIRGLDRLLEDTLDPNRNVDQAFRLTTLYLKGGQVVPGLVLREEGEIIILADNMGKEVRVPSKTVDERIVSQQSPMPANFADQIPVEDFNHLLAYLLAQRPK